MAESSETYSVHPRSRGYAVIINNRDFRLHQAYRAAYPRLNISDSTRYGATIDDENMQYILGTKLKFKLLQDRTYMNVNKYPYKLQDQPFWIHSKPPANKIHCKCLSCEIQRTDHSKTDCFVLAICTHGVQVDGEQEICFSDDFCADRVKLADIIETLKDENCKTLSGKPRIIILNMCRSDPDIPLDKQDEVWHDDGFVIGKAIDITKQFENLDIAGASGDRSNQEIQKLKKTEDDDEAGVKVVPDEEFFYGTEEALQKLPSNFLVVFPCVRGKKTFHNFKYGSWLIEEMRKVVEEHDFARSPEMNFLSVLTKTAGQVAFDKESEKGKKSAVCIVHRLLEPIIFRDVKQEDEKEPDLGEDKPANL